LKVAQIAQAPNRQVMVYVYSSDSDKVTGIKVVEVEEIIGYATAGVCKANMYYHCVYNLNSSSTTN
jgi:hypothetical protein